MDESTTQQSEIVGAVLTLNEESNMPRCLRSLRRFDRVIVVDSGSSDRTVHVAKSLGAEVLVHRQEGPFDIAEQRNWLLDRSSIREGDWVLFLDADEVVTDDCHEAIAAAVNSGCLGAYELTPKYVFEGAWMRRCMGYPNWHPRLVKKGAARFEGGVWEHFDTTEVGRVTTPYLHYGNSKGFDDWIERHQRYSSWEAQRAHAYLSSQDVQAFGTTRAVGKRAVAARMWRLRPLARFIWMYLWRGGFLDGAPAFKFCLRYAVYEYMIVEKIAEIRRLESRQEL